WQILVSETASDAFCDVIGATVMTAGAACNPSANPPQDCVQGLVCLGDNKCHQLCDASGNHNCPTAMMCIGAQYLASDGQTVLMAPGPSMGGWCITPMDAGTSILYTRPLAWQKNIKGGYK